MSRTYKWAQLSKRQQGTARDIRQQLWDLGLSATVSQIAKHYDAAVAWRDGELSDEEFARVVDAVATGAPATDADRARGELAQWTVARRDDMVRTALAAGVTKTEVYELTGIARTTIDRIAAREGTGMQTLEFSHGTGTIGGATDAVRRAVPGEIAPSVSQAGRLGFEVTAGAETVARLREALEAEGETCYVTGRP